MKKKEYIKNRFSILENNPTRKERIDALFNGSIIQVTVEGNTDYYKLDKYHRLMFSYTGHPDSFHPYYEGFNYDKVLDDFDHNGNKKTIKLNKF